MPFSRTYTPQVVLALQVLLRKEPREGVRTRASVVDLATNRFSRAITPAAACGRVYKLWQYKLMVMATARDPFLLEQLSLNFEASLACPLVSSAFEAVQVGVHLWCASLVPCAQNRAWHMIGRLCACVVGEQVLSAHGPKGPATGADGDGSMPRIDARTVAGTILYPVPVKRLLAAASMVRTQSPESSDPRHLTMAAHMTGLHLVVVHGRRSA